MIGSNNPRISQCIVKANEEAFFYYAMNDLEELIDQYGAAFIVEHCKIEDSKLIALQSALNAHFSIKVEEVKE